MRHQRSLQTKTAEATRQKSAAASVQQTLPARPPLHPILQLQQIIGNRAVQRLIQTKSKMGQPGDVYELEADHVADAVMQMPEPSVQQQDKLEEMGQRKAIANQVAPLDSDRQSSKVPPIVSEVLNSSGQPLNPEARAFMESRFSHDFSQVRVHTDAKAAESAQALDALAYTGGHDIVFGTSQYAPGTSKGKRLLAHELTHTLQQSDSSGLKHAQGAVVRLKKDKPREEKKIEEKKGLTRLYEHRYRGYLITKYSLKGIDFLVGVDESMISTIEGNLGAISNAIVAANAWIKDAALQVKTCIIAPTTTRYATYQDKPVLALNPFDANSETATHEMGHAIFELYSTTSGQPKSETRSVGFIIADIFLRLASTKQVKESERDASGNNKPAEHPAGLWIADPSQWSKTLATEHPWDDADEFFASARKAFLLDQKGFKAVIDKFTKLDPLVKEPAKELLAILSQLAGGKVPKAPKAMSEGTGEHIAKIPKATKIEDTLNSSMREVLRWTLDPSTLPKSKPIGPSIGAPKPD